MIESNVAGASKQESKHQENKKIKNKKKAVHKFYVGADIINYFIQSRNSGDEQKNRFDVFISIHYLSSYG